MTGHQKVVASTASEIKKRAGENLLPKIWSSQAADSNIEHNDLDVSAPFSPPYAYQANACTKQNRVDYHQNYIAPWKLHHNFVTTASQLHDNHTCIAWLSGTQGIPHRTGLKDTVMKRHEAASFSLWTGHDAVFDSLGKVTSTSSGEAIISWLLKCEHCFWTSIIAREKSSSLILELV